MNKMQAKSYGGGSSAGSVTRSERSTPSDVYFSADVETDGPIPGPFSMLSFALIPAGRLDGERFLAPSNYEDRFYVEIAPISTGFEPAALSVNGLDRDRLIREGRKPAEAMKEAAEWIRARCDGGEPVLVAYPLGFDWLWLHWYFIQFLGASPFKHSRAFDLKTAVAVTEGVAISSAGRSRLPARLASDHEHTHRADDDAIAQAEIFAKVMKYAQEKRGR